MASKNFKKAKDDDGQVAVSREEYEALTTFREETIAKEAKAAQRSYDLNVTCEAQAKRLVELELALRHHERVTGLQHIYIDMLRSDHRKVASMEDLSEFWRQWSVHTSNIVQDNPQLRDVVSKTEPDLFHAWSSWVRSDGKSGRQAPIPATRAAVDAQQPATQGEMQASLVNSLRDRVAAMAATVHQLESEIETYRKARGT